MPCLRRRRALSRNERGLAWLPIVQSRVPAACGPAPTRAGGCGRGLLGHGGGPEEAGELADDGDGGDVAGLAARTEALVEAVEAPLRAEGDLEDVVGLAGAPLGEGGADARPCQVVPGRLDQQPPRVAGAGLRDRALAAALPGLADELVLIVDDNEKNMRLARDVLHFAGFRTLEAASGGEGVSLALEHLPDVILMDIRLLDMDGTDAARQLKDDARTARIPVVALTSLAMKGDREWFLAAGFDGYLEKPISVRSSPSRCEAIAARRTKTDIDRLLD